MASTYTTNLGLTLPTTGELAGTWGSTVNTGVTTLIDDAVSGTSSVTMTGANKTLTATVGVANEARSMFITLGGSPGGSYNVIVPSTSKLYFVTNNTGYSQTIKTSGGTGISVATGTITPLYCDATNVVNAVTPAVTLGANTFTAGQNFARATVASHATTADIWAAAGNQIDWTGTATTTIFPNAPQAGAERVLICAGACSFTAGANMLIDGVASAATVTCAANDQVTVRAVSTTQFKLSRIKYDGTAQVGADAIRTPTNVTPAAAATGVLDIATLTGSAFLSLYGLTMSASQWQVSTVSNFATTVISTGDVAGTAISYAMTSGVLAVSTVYYWRCRYKDSEGTYSAWSTAFSFTSASIFNSFITTPTATPAAMGDSFEGGFYTGMIWNELVQSTTSYLIGTGSKAFTVADMAATPIVYFGQALEIRSRANPANKMVCTVASAAGTVLTVTVSSVGGSGTFTDWSIMAQYRVIVAPKSTGENSAIAYKNANDAAPAACGTLSEGRKATLAMVAAGTSTVYPAAHWCNNLSIAGKTDWYLPARDELELCWRNLKPTADANYVTADRPTAATPNYMNLGSYGDTANTHGLDNNSSPVGAAHISGTPAQVAAGKNFRTSESEAFAYGSFYYWSASEYSATAAWNQYWHSSLPGYQNGTSKTNASYVRAVRRSII